MRPNSPRSDDLTPPTAREQAAATRRRRTEERIVAAATELFLREGYAATSIAAVAEAAGVSERTVYVRFASKVVLFQRVIEVGIVGDVDATPMPQREWSVDALTAATTSARIAAFADGVSAMHERLGPLMAVNGEVEGSEPSVQDSAGRWRAATRDYLALFWTTMRTDGLLPASVDLPWLIDTTTVLTAAESRLLITRTMGWRRAVYQQWVVTSMTRAAQAAADA
ncbi:helix-turn-helix domain-containing protein [Microbacterium sp. bgisy189]|uniref:TetR/AcrR family transcriptional regulator n=1 Tax=Microbacterium sp. bgisy189 TaxID=3413798 RepID=UPI003EB9AD0B